MRRSNKDLKTGLLSGKSKKNDFVNILHKKFGKKDEQEYKSLDLDSLSFDSDDDQIDTEDIVIESIKPSLFSSSYSSLTRITKLLIAITIIITIKKLKFLDSFIKLKGISIKHTIVIKPIKTIKIRQ
jgi:hypothetical protein